MRIPIKLKLKFLFFDHYWWMLSLCGVATVAFLFSQEEPLSTVGAAVGAFLSSIYFVQKQRLEELKLFRELFKEFNERYDKMNEKLARIREETHPDITANEREALVDYFNLCGEEYLYFAKGYIDPTVWQAWHAGMKDITSVPRIQGVWQTEKKTGSYYGLPL